ncbi:phytanoyl-CoA dioxygenase family protein [Micromonospora sp. NPDC050980]|uniref:phytanoyl-CoA dioxygenase family protein n=1 Tax=Micromonospora sp. NPDC050980 TaxID=3155161 RepID=UPI0033EC3F65
MSAMLDQLRTDGFAAVAAVDESLLSELRSEADWLVRRFADEGYRSDDYWFFNAAGAGEPVLYRVHNLENQGSTPITRLYAEGPLHTLAKEILGTRGHATACAMIVKMPGLAARVPWHRDRTSVTAHTMFNLSLFLDDSVLENGCLEFVPGSHLLPDDADVAQTCERGPVQPVPAAAGDVLAHDVRVVHGSRTNTSTAYRRSIVIEFAPVGLVLTGRDG